MGNERDEREREMRERERERYDTHSQIGCERVMGEVRDEKCGKSEADERRDVRCGGRTRS
jgi:hypothetical protein